MARSRDQVCTNVASIEAEENLLIDMQFMLQRILTDKGISRADLAKRIGVSKSRLSQVFAAEANPTLKTWVRLFHAIGEELTVGLKEMQENHTLIQSYPSDWLFDLGAVRSHEKDNAEDRFVTAVKNAVVSNDNYVDQVEIIDGDPEGGTFADYATAA